MPVLDVETSIHLNVLIVQNKNLFCFVFLFLHWNWQNINWLALHPICAFQELWILSVFCALWRLSALQELHFSPLHKQPGWYKICLKFVVKRPNSVLLILNDHAIHQWSDESHHNICPSIITNSLYIVPWFIDLSKYFYSLGTQDT